MFIFHFQNMLSHIFKAFKSAKSIFFNFFNWFKIKYLDKFNMRNKMGFLRFGYYIDKKAMIIISINKSLMFMAINSSLFPKIINTIRNLIFYMRNQVKFRNRIRVLCKFNNFFNCFFIRRVYVLNSSYY